MNRNHLTLRKEQNNQADKKKKKGWNCLDDGRNPVFSFSLIHFLSLIFVYIVYDLLIVFIIIIICVVEAGSHLSFDWQFCSCPTLTPTS